MDRIYKEKAYRTAYNKILLIFIPPKNRLIGLTELIHLQTKHGRSFTTEKVYLRMHLIVKFA